MWRVVTEPFSRSMEVEAVGLEGEVQANEVANIGSGRWEVTAKYFRNFECPFFGNEYFMWY